MNTRRAEREWDPVQILVPVIVGVGVIALAALGFLWYHRHRRQQATPRRVPWEQANLRPRRRFGILPDRRTVRTVEPGRQWEIDDGTPGIEPPPTPSPPPGPSSRAGTPSHLTQTHSRTTSESPLLPRANSHPNFKVVSKPKSSRGPSSATSSTSSSRFASITNRLKPLASNQHHKYTTGVPTAPDFKRGNVVPKSPHQQFDIDEANSPDRATPLVTLPKSTAKPTTALPSVLDIRGEEDENGNIILPDDAHRGLLTERGIQQLQARNQTQESMSDVVFALPAPPPVSDFSLGTSDLMTPSSTQIRGRPFPSPPAATLPPVRAIPIS